MKTGVIAQIVAAANGAISTPLWVWKDDNPKSNIIALGFVFSSTILSRLLNLMRWLYVKLSNQNGCSIMKVSNIVKTREEPQSREAVVVLTTQ